MSNQPATPDFTPVSSIPLIPIYACGFMSAATVSLSFRFQNFTRAALLGVGLLSASIAVWYFVRFLLAADELVKAINYGALVFGFVSFLALALVLEFLRSFGVPLPSIPPFGIPVTMIVLWTIRLIVAASQRRHNEGRNE